MENPRSSQIATALALRAGNEANAAQVTGVIVSIWHDIDAALRPLIGQWGVVALYKRSLHLTSAAYPWLAETQAEAQTSIDVASLKSVLMRQSSINAAAGGSALLHTFRELLTTLIGASLTEQLLRPVWTNLLGDQPAQDTAP